MKAIASPALTVGLLLELGAASLGGGAAFAIADVCAQVTLFWRVAVVLGVLLLPLALLSLVRNRPLISTRSTLYAFCPLASVAVARSASTALHMRPGVAGLMGALGCMLLLVVVARWRSQH
jgi:hypothetical protein